MNNETERLLLMLLSRSGSNIKGKTKFQKIMYILKNEYGHEIPEFESFNFKLHYYGPYSRKIDSMLTKLVFRRQLSVETEEFGNCSRYNYKLTSYGKQVAQTAYDTIDNTRARIINDMAQKVRELNDEPLNSVISKAYEIAENEGL
ncbi:MAG: hypothetical protein WC325_08760 [Candidatus Bathyarchaeia archaeon]